MYQSYPLEVGSIRNNGAYSLNGMVDDIRIFDEPLTAGEAWFTYNGVGGGGLVAHCPQHLKDQLHQPEQEVQDTSRTKRCYKDLRYHKV